MRAFQVKQDLHYVVGRDTDIGDREHNLKNLQASFFFLQTIPHDRDYLVQTNCVPYDQQGQENKLA